MTSTFILYLSIEGVLVPLERPVSRYRTERLAVDKPHARELADMLLDTDRIRIVINSAWIPISGFRTVLDMLPTELGVRVIGATAPGNRLLRNHRTACPCSKSRWLADDVNRREPTQLTVLDSDSRNVPVPLRDRAVIVPDGLWAASRDDWTRLRHMLVPPD
ncbi:HAD domain-containing protein [Paraburkholderia sp. EG287A]|uniref:HAD domain-containing protein n=1 Tax=Paraburkholderia sp. EG287A TaxID=3237012 RepID=UPI0034D25F1C